MVVPTPQVLIVGLGNIPFPATRHSVGHYILDSLALRLGTHFDSVRSRAGLYAQKTVKIGENSVDITLFKPKALMNISGRSVASALRNTARSPASMIVIHDSLDHKILTLSPKFGGSANGHNGVKSVITSLGGNKDFHRLRIGIGRDEYDSAAYVLGKMSLPELKHWRPNGAGTELVWESLQETIQSILSKR